MRRLIPRETAIIVVDVQERLAAAMPEDQLQQVVRAARILVHAARLLGAPAFFTEQYPKGLGATLPEVSRLLEAARATRWEKQAFSAWDADGFPAAFRQARPRVAIVLGMEAHVCVYQTVRDLQEQGFGVQVPIDGVSSRRADHRELGLALCERAGAVRTSAESVVFDWLGRAGGAAFKELSQLMR